MKTQTHRDDRVNTGEHREEIADYMPRRKASGGTGPVTPYLQDYEIINCYENCLLCGTCCGCTRTLIQTLMLQGTCPTPALPVFTSRPLLGTGGGA